MDEISKQFTAAHWDTLESQVTSNLDLTQSILGDDFDMDDYAEKMVALVKQKRKAEAEKKAKEKRDKPWTKAQIIDYMRTFVKNQSSAVHGATWTKKKVWGFSDSKLTTEYERLLDNLHQSGINVIDPLEKHGSLLGEPAIKRLRVADSADTLLESTDPFPAD